MPVESRFSQTRWRAHRDHRFRTCGARRRPRPGADGISPDDLRDGARAGGHALHGSTRLPASLIRAEISVIEALGVEIRCNTEIGKDIPFDQLRKDYAAVIIAVGAKRSRPL